MKRASTKILAVVLALMMLLIAVPVVTAGATTVKDGKWILSDNASSIVSQETYVDSADENAQYEKATITLAPGAYAQLDKLLMKNYIGVDLKQSNYANMNADIQFVADATASTNINLVDEGNGEVPGTDGMSWKFLGDGSGVWVGRGSGTVNGAFYSAAGTIDEIKLAFEADNKGKITTRGRWYWVVDPSFQNATLKSQKSAFDLDGFRSSMGLYFRLHNSSAEAVTYTVKVFYYPEHTDLMPEETVTIDQEISNGTISVGDAFANPGETVTVTVTPAEGYQLKAGSLRANGVPITTRVNKGVDETSCDKFSFTNLSNQTTITAEFISATEANMAVLGAAFKEEDLRFVSRAYRTKGGAALVAAGQLLMRADCDLAATIEDGVAVANIEALLARAAEGATGANAVKNIPTTMLNDRCTDYIDFAVRINGAGAEAYKNVEYVCISYATYADGATVYSAACTRSYNDVNPSQEPEPSPADEAFTMLASPAAFAHEYHGLISSVSSTEDTVTVNCGLALPQSQFAGFTLTQVAVKKWRELGFETFTFTVGLSADSGTVPTHVDIYLSGTDFFLTTPDAIDGTDYYYANGREVTLDLVKLLAAMENVGKNLKFVMTNGGSWTATNGPASFTFSNIQFN